MNDALTQPAADTKSITCTPGAFAQLSAGVLASGKTLRFTAHGQSMRPLVQDGDILRVEKVGEFSLNVGDVVLCLTMEDRLLAHRIVDINKTDDQIMFLIRGDQAPRVDGWLPAEKILGRVCGLERAGNQINHDEFGMKVLNHVAAWRLRYGLDQHKLTRQAGMLLKHFPIFCRHF